LVTGESAELENSEAAIATAEAALNTALSSDLDNTIFADVRVGEGVIATYSFESFDDLNTALIAFVAILGGKGVSHRFKPSLQIQELPE
jgi:hypothetical protein